MHVLNSKAVLLKNLKKRKTLTFVQFQHFTDIERKRYIPKIMRFVTLYDNRIVFWPVCSDVPDAVVQACVFHASKLSFYIIYRLLRLTNFFRIHSTCVMTIKSRYIERFSSRSLKQVNIFYDIILCIVSYRFRIITAITTFHIYFYQQHFSFDITAFFHHSINF